MRRRLLLANSHGSGWSEKTMTFYVNNITGTITDTIAYTAYEGMTWGDWITSEFNVDAFYIYAGGQVRNATGQLYKDKVTVLERNYIIADYHYTAR